MSIMRRPVYRQTGGPATNFYEEDITYGPQPGVAQPTGPNLVGAGAAGSIAGGINTGIAADATLDEAYQGAANFHADPSNTPAYYSESTVADFTPTQLQAQQRLVDVAGQQDTLTNQQVAQYQARLDPDSERNRIARERASQSAGSAYFGAGTPGSARGLYASNVAAQDAQYDNENDALARLRGLRGDLRGGADVLNEVGGARQDLTQDYINEDVKKWNYAQLAPGQQVDRQLAVRQQQEALKNSAGGAGGEGGQSWQDRLKGGLVDWGVDKATDWFSDLFLNEGGPVPQQGGGIMGGVPQGQSVGNMTPQSMAQMPPMEEMSQVDMIEDRLNALAETSNGRITVTRKETRRRAK